MELAEIVARYARALEIIDLDDAGGRVNPRTKELYLPGLKTMREEEVVSEVARWWQEAHPEDFVGVPRQRLAVPYPGLPGAKCDHVVTTDGNDELPEWGIEVKKPELIGNNGKPNDYAVAKMVSPFLKDRSLLHDVLRLRENPLARRHAVLFYAFQYDDETCFIARGLHPAHYGFVANIEKVVRTNGGKLGVEELANFFDAIVRLRNLVVGPYARREFKAWRHPCGGTGVVLGWEVSPAPDKKHPW